MDIDGKALEFLLELDIIKEEDVRDGRYTLTDETHIERLMAALPKFPTSTDPRDTPGSPEHETLLKAAAVAEAMGLHPEELEKALSSSADPKRLILGMSQVHPEDMRHIVESVFNSTRKKPMDEETT